MTKCWIIEGRRPNEERRRIIGVAPTEEMARDLARTWLARLGNTGGVTYVWGATDWVEIE